MDNRFEILNNSVMFNLSLSSKELFHSNFLAFLFKCENTLFCKVINVDNFRFDVQREHKNIDIEIIGNNKKYIIENKVKDIIDEAQIEKIENDYKNGDYNGIYLFSLLGNNLEMLEHKHILWKEISYERIVEILKNHSFNDSYLESIKNDYCNFMTTMISLLKEQYLNCDTYIIYWKNEMVQRFSEIRIHDLFIKYGMSHFVNYFRKNNHDNEIRIRYGVNRAKATMTFSKQFSGVEYGIQTEDLDYRRYIIGNIKSRELFEEKGWFNKDWISASGKKYLKYDTKTSGITFWYQNKFSNRIIENISYDKLVNYIKSDINIIS
jgi:hypothetical protein